jgi:hypothetical protein
MKKIILVNLLVLGFIIQGGMAYAGETTVKERSLPNPPRQELGARTARITNAPQGAGALIGSSGVITAINGNRVTMRNEADTNRIVTVIVNSANAFRVGDRVAINQNTLAVRTPGGERGMFSDTNLHKGSHGGGEKDSGKEQHNEKDSMGGKEDNQSQDFKEIPSQPDPPPDERGTRSTKIIAAAKGFNSVIGDRGVISAIQGNQVTMHALNDRTRIITIGVNNASRFRVGDRVNIAGNVMRAEGTANASQRIAPAQVRAR